MKDRLPWLTKKQKDDLIKIINDTLIDNLRVRHWGNISDHSSDETSILITDYRGLMLAIGTLKYTLNKMNTSILYRGQTKDYELKPSIYRNCKTKSDFEKNEKWLDSVISTARTYFDPIGTDDEREALLQHYGCKTRWLDVVDHIQTALWFAAHTKRDVEGVNCDDSVGFVYIVAYPTINNTFTVVKDLRLKPADWMRPHIQQGFSIRSYDTKKYGRSLKHLRVATFIIPRELLFLWANMGFLNEAYIYPGVAFDKALYYWEKTKEDLNKNKIDLLPPIM